MEAAFDRFTAAASAWLARPAAFLLALAVVLAWAPLGPVFSYSESWQIWINTGTTIVTFLMVFLIQSTQSRDTAAFHLKLNALIRVSEANDELIAVEERTAAEIAKAAQALRDQAV